MTSDSGGRGRRPRAPMQGRVVPRRRPAPRAQVSIESIAAGGEGVGRLPDGRAVFVHRTAPGDTAEAEVVESHARWARGRLLRVLTPGAGRREAPCPFYRRCGGCTLEHLRYEAQLEAKGRIVADALTRIGHLPVDPPAVVPSPRTERYRNRVSFALRRAERGRVLAGFHALASPDEIVDVDGRCLLPEPAIARVWDLLREHWGPDAQRLPSGEQLRLTLRSTTAGAVSLLVEGGFSPGRPQELLEAVEGLKAIWHRPPDGRARLLAGSPALEEQWGGEIIAVAADAFLQVNREAAALLEAHVLELAGDVAGRRVVDAYCGVGINARRLARAGAQVVGIELDRAAIAAAREPQVQGAEFLEGTVEALLPEVLPASLVILNPPRSGVAPEVVNALLESPAESVIYVSCNPATLARDVSRLASHYRLQDVRAFDLFPQTAHVETVALLTLDQGLA
ncbi:MAG TPA: class I SAM-dependent RNA methyltransferase [Longimicrobiaceae bacterium]